MTDITNVQVDDRDNSVENADLANAKVISPRPASTEEHNSGGDVKPADSAFKPIESQSDLDRIIQARIARERDKYKDYEEKSAQAAKYQEFLDSKKTDDQRREEQTKALEAEVEALQSKVTAFESEKLKAKIAAENKLPEWLWKFVDGDDETSIGASIADLLETVPQDVLKKKVDPVPSARAVSDDVTVEKNSAAGFDPRSLVELARKSSAI